MKIEQQKKGHGRPRLNKSDKKVRLTVRLSPGVIEKLNSMRVNRSRFIEQSILKNLPKVFYNYMGIDCVISSTDEPYDTVTFDDYSHHRSCVDTEMLLYIKEELRV